MSIPHKWMYFRDSELQILKCIVDDHCERYEDTCDVESDLADEIDDEIDRRRLQAGVGDK